MPRPNHHPKNLKQVGTINEMPVYIANDQLSLAIKHDDIKRGSVKDPGGCAAARAACRLPGVHSAKVHLAITLVEKDGYFLKYQTPKSLRDQIVSFDRAGIFDEGDHTLIPMCRSAVAKIGNRTGTNKPGARDKGSKDRTPKRPRSKPHILNNVRHWGVNR